MLVAWRQRRPSGPIYEKVGKVCSLVSNFGCAIGGFGLLIWIARAAACSVGTSISVPKLAMQSGRSSLGKCKSPALRRGIYGLLFVVVFLLQPFNEALYTFVFRFDLIFRLLND